MTLETQATRWETDKTSVRWGDLVSTTTTGPVIATDTFQTEIAQAMPIGYRLMRTGGHGGWVLTTVQIVVSTTGLAERATATTPFRLLY